MQNFGHHLEPLHYTGAVSLSTGPTVCKTDFLYHAQLPKYRYRYHLILRQSDGCQPEKNEPPLIPTKNVYLPHVYTPTWFFDSEDACLSKSINELFSTGFRKYAITGVTLFR